MRLISLSFGLLLCAATAMSGIPDSVRQYVRQGDFAKATRALSVLLQSPAMSGGDSTDCAFEIERLARIRKDFTLSREDVTRQLIPWYGDSAAAMVARYSSDGSLEMKTIDGTPRYFKSAVPNLFRVNPVARQLKIARKGNAPDSLGRLLRREIPAEQKAFAEGKALSVRIRYRYTLTVHADAVPAGETIRCWLPFPRTDVPRQKDVKLLASSAAGILSSKFDPDAHSTFYMEETAAAGVPTVFWVDVEYTSQAERAPLLSAGNGAPANLEGRYVEERPPHIEFSPRIRELNARIIDAERNRTEILRRIFRWISDSIPWASAREYSTISSIANYCVRERHGDCGIQTMLFMTLARLNGIPAHWQSGWMMHPGDVDMHDWCEINPDGTRWIPVDQSFGLQRWASNADDRWFYLGGIDRYRLVVNNEFSAPLFPPKTFPRSETVDFQRGEVEWRGGNLYFDQWSYSMDVQYHP